MENNRSKPSLLWIGAAIAGGFAIGLSCLIVLLILVVPKMHESPLLVVSIGISLIALLLGIGLVWAGLTGLKHLPAPKLYTRWEALGLLLLTIALVLVAVFVTEEIQHRALFAPLHLGVAALPPGFLLALLTWVAGRERTLSLRELIATASGGALAPLMAIPVEGLGLALSAAFAAGVAYLVPGGRAEVARLITLLEGWAVNPPVHLEEAVVDLVSPVSLLTLALTLAVVAPLIEEFGKTLVMGMMGIWKRPGLTLSFLWGAACGLGFAVVEGVTNGASGLGSVEGWIGGMGARALAAAMHMLTSGIIGLGWGFWWRKRHWVLPLTYIAAVIFHGAWNFNVVVILGGAGLGMQDSPVGLVISVLGIGGQVLLALFAPTALLVIPLLLRRYENQAVATTN